MGMTYPIGLTDTEWTCVQPTRPAAAMGTCMDRSLLVYLFVLGGTEERLGTTQTKRKFYA